MFIGNFHGTFKCLSIAETLKTIRQKHDESLWDYVKCFFNARNTIPYIQDIEIINAFYDGVCDIKNVEEIAMKKPKMGAELLAIVDVYIDASIARAQLLESRGKGPSRKKDDWEVNIADQGDLKDRGDSGYRSKQSSKQKEKRPFWRPDDTEKWCEIHRTATHDLEESKTFLDHKKMPLPAAPLPQEPWWVNQHRVDSKGDEQKGEINVIFRGSMHITSKTYGKKFQHEITLA
jgi:hypothetical protein